GCPFPGGGRIVHVYQAAYLDTQFRRQGAGARNQCRYYPMEVRPRGLHLQKNRCDAAWPPDGKRSARGLARWQVGGAHQELQRVPPSERRQTGATTRRRWRPSTAGGERAWLHAQLGWVRRELLRSGHARLVAGLEEVGRL